MNYTIRPATHADLPLLRTFEQGVIEAERPYDPTIRRGDTHYYDIPTMIDSEETELVVAETNGELVGCGYARIERAKVFERHAFYCYLGFMYVTPAYRGKGVNQLVLDALRRWSAGRGISEMRLEVYQENETALRAYRKAGFSSLLVTMRMGWNGDETPS